MRSLVDVLVRTALLLSIASPVATDQSPIRIHKTRTLRVNNYFYLLVAMSLLLAGCGHKKSGVSETLTTNQAGTSNSVTALPKSVSPTNSVSAEEKARQARLKEFIEATKPEKP